MKRSPIVCAFGAAALCGALGCSAADSPEPEVVSATVEPIIGGVAATEYPEAAILDMQSPSGGYACTATLIAPKVVLTAGHCVDGMTSWTVYVGGTSQTTTSAETYDWKENGATTVNPAHHDLGLVYLSNAITLGTYPTLAVAPLATGASVVNVGRIRNGVFTSSLWKASVTISMGTLVGYPFDYASNDVIEHGDSGGPVFESGTHRVVAVNSGAGGGTQVLARVDLLSTWLQARVAAHGGFASSGPADAGADSSVKTDAGVVDSGAKPDAAKDSATDGASEAAVDSGSKADAGAPACTKEVESNDVFAKSNPLAALECGAYGAAGDIDNYTFTAPIGTTKVGLTGSGSFAIGFVTNGSCLSVLSAQTAVSITVTGAAKPMCLIATSPTKSLGSYTITRQ